MRLALVNPPWTFHQSIYFGCREPHLPLEYGSAKVLLEQAGHEARIFDGHLFGLSMGEIARLISDYAPDATVVTTAPSYLFWRCAPPELRVPMETVQSIRPWAGALVVVGPHASTTPNATLNKLGADAVVLGECEEILPLFADSERRYWDRIPSICYEEEGDIRTAGGSPHASDMKALP